MSCTFKSLLSQLFTAGTERVDGERLIANALTEASHGRYGVVSLGKAGPAMMSGAISALAGRIESGLLICKRGHDDSRSFEGLPVEAITGGHPVPDADSLHAGDRLGEFASSLGQETRLLFLISGGASSLAEVLPPTVSMDELQRLNRFLLGCGLGIAAVNAIRKSVSMIKGGGLLHSLGGRHAEVFLLSDVPDDDPATIGSGPLWPARASVPGGLPGWVSDLAKRAAATRPSLDLEQPAHRIVGTQDDARDGVCAWASGHGLQVQDHGRQLYGEVGTVSQRIAGVLTATPDAMSPIVHVWSGEPELALPDEAGHGGRNQHLALRVARLLSDRKGWCLLAAGSDGDDAETGAAGAFVDGSLCAAAVDAGFDVDQALALANSDFLLRELDALLLTGPTGTNVADLAIAISGQGVALDRVCKPVHTGLMAGPERKSEMEA